MGIGAVLKKGSAWNSIQVGAASLLLHGKDFYHQIGGFTYPPFDAFFATPFALMNARLARSAWYIISVISLVYLVRKSWQLAGGPPVEPGKGRPAAPPREQIAFLLGNLIAVQFALNALSHLQSDLLIAALIMAGCGAMMAGRFIRSATWIGLAAAFKATPLLFAPYLLWRRKPLAAGWLIAIAIGVNLLPNLVHSPPSGGLWLTQWAHRYLEPMTRSQYLPGDWKNQLNNNQAIAGATRRWTGTTWKAAPGDFKVFDRPNGPSPATIRNVYYGSCLLILIPALWLAWKRWGARDVARHDSGGTGLRQSSVERVSPVLAAPAADDRQHGRDAHATDRPVRPDPRLIECGIILLLMLLLSPNSSIAHFCVMYLPAFCVARIVVYEDRPVLGALFGLAVLCAVLSIRLRLPVTYVPEQVLLWLGIVTFSTIFLMLACVIALGSKTGPPSRQVARE